MAELNDAAEAAERLERALDRIAALTAGLAPVLPESPAPDTEASAEVARRLDDLIGRIRTVLGPDAGG